MAILLALHSRTFDLWLFYTSLAIYVLCFSATVAEMEDLEACARQAVRQALFHANLSIKEAAYRMEMDESQLRKQLMGEQRYHLSFFRMLSCWPLEFWLAFAPMLFALIARKRLMEMAEDFGLVKRA